MRPRILVIDDDETNLRIVEEVLEDVGYQPILADNAMDGLELLQTTSHIKLVLLDWMMPKMNGMQMLEQIRASKDFGEVPVIMLTALDKKEQVQQAIKSGADYYIVKPFDGDTLVEKVRSVMLGTGSVRKRQSS